MEKNRHKVALWSTCLLISFSSDRFSSTLTTDIFLSTLAQYLLFQSFFKIYEHHINGKIVILGCCLILSSKQLCTNA